MAKSIASRSLSARMLWLTIGIVLTTEALAFAPGVARERQRWMAEKFAQADLAILLVSGAPGGQIDTQTRDALLKRAGLDQVHLVDSGKQLIGVGPQTLPEFQTRIDLRRESWVRGVARALATLTSDGTGVMSISDQSPFTVGTALELVVPESGLKESLWRFTVYYAVLSLLIASINGAMVYFALVFFLVAPMRRITHSIRAFRSDPERVQPLDPRGVTMLPDDEMAFASREIAAMQSALSMVLGRNARLVSVGTSVSKICHDLRNVLAPALLMSERLETHDDPAVRRSGEVIMSSVERASELVGQTLKFVRDSPAPSASVRFPLAPVVTEAIDTVGSSTGCRMRHEIGQELHVNADPNQILRVLVNLIRNAAEAGSHNLIVKLASGRSASEVAIDVVDDGDGLPVSVRETLFRPFTRSTKPGGSGLGLAIAHDLIRANNGEMTLEYTGPGGTLFRLTLPTDPLPVSERAG
jgi:signal transduction histidine kinase